MDSNSDYMSRTEDTDDDIEESKEVSKSVQIQDCTCFRGTSCKDLTFEDVKDVEFVHHILHHSFVNGFRMMKDMMDKNHAGTLVTRRDLVCSKQGVREESGKSDKKYTIADEEPAEYEREE